MPLTLPIAPSDTCSECGQGIAFIITTDGAGWFHIGPYDESTHTQTVHERCPGPGYMAQFWMEP
jgi:hypothetical protein